VTRFSFLFFFVLLFASYAMPQQIADCQRITGQITDGRTHRGVAGANVSLAGGMATQDAISDVEGTYILELTHGVKCGQDLRLRVTKAGYTILDKWITVPTARGVNVTLEAEGRHSKATKTSKPPKEAGGIKPTYDRAHLAVMRVDLWAAPMHSEAMVTVRNVGSKPIMPCALLRGAIIAGPWLNGSEPEDRLFVRRPEWQEGGRGQLLCQGDWNPGVDKTYSIQRLVPGDGPNEWTSLMLGEEVWYVVSRLEYRDSDMGSSLPVIENCVYFRAEKPEWTINKCYGHNDPTLGGGWTTGSGHEGSAPAEKGLAK
jgi:hypothetical protein